MVVFQRHALALRRLQRQGQHMGGKELALVTRTVALAVQGRIQAVAQLLHQHTQQVGVGGQAIEPLAVDKHLGAARGAARSKGSHGAAQLLIGGQRQRDAACPLQPLLLYRLGMKQHAGIAAITGKKGLNIQGVGLAQKRLHGRSGLPIDRLQPSISQVTAQAAGHKQAGLRRIDCGHRPGPRHALVGHVLAQVQLTIGRGGGSVSVDLSGLHHALPQGLRLLHRKSHLQGSGDRCGRQQPARLQPLNGKAACSTSLLLSG